MAGNRKAAPQAPAKSDILDAVVMLAREKDIGEDLIISAIEEACKAAYRKSIKKGSAPANLAVSLTRQKGVQVFARKLEKSDPKRFEVWCEMHPGVDIHADDGEAL